MVDVLPCPPNKVCINGIVYTPLQYTTDINSCAQYFCDIIITTEEQLIDISIYDPLVDSNVENNYNLVIKDVKHSNICQNSNPFTLDSNNIITFDQNQKHINCTHYLITLHDPNEISTLGEFNIFVSIKPSTVKATPKARSVSMALDYYCWINNDNNGYGGSVQCSETYMNHAPLSSTNGFIKITSGGNHTCGLTFQNNVKCWGGTFKTTHLGKTTHLFSPSVDQYFLNIEANEHTSCAHYLDQSVTCYSLDSYFNIIDTSNKYFDTIKITDNGLCGNLINQNTLNCWGGPITFYIINTVQMIDYDVYYKNGCLLVQDGTNTYPHCFGTIYPSTGHSFSGSIDYIKKVYHGNDFLCYSDSSYQVSCLGDTRPLSRTNNINLFQNSVILQWSYMDDNSIFIDNQNTVRLEGKKFINIQSNIDVY